MIVWLQITSFKTEWRGVYAEHVSSRKPKSPEKSRVSDDRLPLMSPKGRIAHLDHSPFFLPKFVTQMIGNVVLSWLLGVKLAGWGTATCFYSAALSPNCLGIVKASAGHGVHTHANPGGGRVWVVAFVHSNAIVLNPMHPSKNQCLIKSIEQPGEKLGFHT